MKRLRVASAALICASVLSLSACGGEDAETTAGSTPSAPAAASASSAPTSSPAAGTTGGASDKKLCEAAKKAGNDMKAALVAALGSGEQPSPAVYKKILADLNQQMTTLAADGDSKVAAAMKQMGAEAAKAAAAADPATAADNPAFEKVGEDLTAACKAAGVDVNF